MNAVKPAQVPKSRKTQGAAPKAPKAPEAPEAQEAPKAPEAPEAQEAPKAPEAPEAPATGTAQEAQEEAATGTTPTKVGVIDTLKNLLLAGGGTVDELFDALAKKFPDRGAGMKTTIRIQVVRLHKDGKLVVAKKEVEGRGTVYSAVAPSSANI
jgi:hypothetical protein